MKRLYLAALLVLMTIGIIISVQYAWFINSEFVEPDISGYSISAYFGGGDGSDDDPYQINNPRHLYNLAWLQYLGYFNKPGSGNTPDENNTTTLTQFSFEINNDLNMDGWYLPPIGTSYNPFIGLLNGNGHTIYNLNTTNKFSDFGQRHPSTVTSSNFSNVEIIGFVGAVGKIDTMNNASYSISSTENAIANIKLKNTTVNTSTPQSLIGIAAGYINGEVQDVGIVRGNLNITAGTKLANFDDVSSYTVAGYAEEQYVTKVSNTNAMVINPTGTTKTSYVYEGNGDITGWGGSIDMYTMYSSILIPKWNSSYTNRNFHYYYTGKTITIDKDGNQTTVYSPEPPTAYERINVGNLGYHDYTYDSSYVNDKKIASYSFFYRESTDAFMYIAGNENRTISNAITSTTVYQDAKLLSDGNGNYLTRNNSSPTNATNPTLTSYWYINDDNEIYNLDGTTKYYLNDDNGTLAIGRIAYTHWNITNNSIKSSEDRYLIYDNGWKLTTNNTIYINGYKFYYDYNNGRTTTRYYLNATSNGISAGTNESAATLWNLNDNNILYTVINGTTYYFCYTNWNRGTIGVTTNGSSDQYLIGYFNNNLRYYNTNNYYIYCNGTWQESTTAYTINNTHIDESTVISTVTQAVPNQTSTENATYTTKTTYFPLQFGQDINGDYGVDVKNTGYLIGGSYRGGSQPSDIRVSRYEMTNINKSYTPSSGFTTIYTINDSGTSVTINNNVINSSGWTKYNDSKSSLLEILKKDSSYVYGLHFMESTININHIITADWVSINGSDYIQNYQLPEDCIDFNLKEKGKVNFFAGTYFNENNSFFSYNEIQRNANNEITNIRQISEIYSDGIESHSYVYKYSDGKYSVPYIITNNSGVITKTTLSGGTYTEYSTQNSLPSGYSSIFKTSWIGKQNSSYTSNRIYYFEVPTNDGEYALGSVSGGKGAYLLYLDIGANAQQVNRTEINQKSVLTQYDYIYPNGIMVILENTTIDTSLVTISLDASLSAVTKVNSTGTISLERISANTINATTSINITSTYIPRTVTLTKNSAAMNASAIKTTTSIYSQIQYIDHNVTTGDIYETTVEQIKTTVVDSTGTTTTTNDPTVKIYNYTTRELIDQSAQSPEWRLYAINNNKNTLVDLTSASDTNATAIKNTLNTVSSSTGTTIFEYNYDTLESATNTYEILINMIIDNNDSTGSYYKFNGDDIVVTTDNDGGTTIYVTTNNQTYTFTVNGNVVSKSTVVVTES